MAEQRGPIDRLPYMKSLEPIIQDIGQFYDIGTITGHEVIDIGYEDCNVIIDTDRDRYVAKMFSRHRGSEDVEDYIDTMKEVNKSDVNHPELVFPKTGNTTFYDNGITMVLMKFIEGKTFLELNAAPNDAECTVVLEQAAKINKLDMKPKYAFDTWAIPNIREMFGQVKRYIQSDELPMVEAALTAYQAIPVYSLPQCFVHGDLTKSNTIRGDDGNIYLLDFSVSGRYPRIQELAVIIANLLHDSADQRSLETRCELVADEYSAFNPLTDEERQHLAAYTLAGSAMMFMGPYRERHVNGSDTAETDYLLNLGREGLVKALAA